jgi:fido (protein-threonine AMPylation protein)
MSQHSAVLVRREDDVERGRQRPPYTNPRTGALWNKLGIEDPVALAEIEADLTFARTVWLTEHPVALRRHGRYLMLL